jgi:hypothetical protein
MAALTSISLHRAAGDTQGTAKWQTHDMQATSGLDRIGVRLDHLDGIGLEHGSTARGKQPIQTLLNHGAPIKIGH